MSSAKKLKKAAAAQKAEQSGKGKEKAESSNTDSKVSAVKASKKPFERKLTVRIPPVESDGSKEVMAHLYMKAGISSNRVSKASSSKSRIYEIQSEDEE